MHIIAYFHNFSFPSIISDFRYDSIIKTIPIYRRGGRINCEYTPFTRVQGLIGGGPQYLNSLSRFSLRDSRLFSTFSHLSVEAQQADSCLEVKSSKEFWRKLTSLDRDNPVKLVDNFFKKYPSPELAKQNIDLNLIQSIFKPIMVDFKLTSRRVYQSSYDQCKYNLFYFNRFFELFTNSFNNKQLVKVMVIISTIFMLVGCESNLFLLKSFLPDLVNNSDFMSDLSELSFPLFGLVHKLRRSPGSPPPRPPSPTRWSKFFKIFTKNLLKFICIMPFILVFKSLYCCLHNDNWTFIYFSQQFISHIPFIGNSLICLLNEQDFQLSDNLIKIHQYIGNLIFSGGVGASIGNAFWELFLVNNKLPMGGNYPDKTTINFQSKINALSSNLMMDNTGEGGKPKSSEVNSPAPSTGGVSDSRYSMVLLDKLIAERNQVLDDTKNFLHGLQEKGNSSSSSNVPATGFNNHVDLLIHLTKIRIKNHQALGEFIRNHISILGHPYVYREIKPLTDEMDRSLEEILTKIESIAPNHPNFAKQQHDFENRIFKKHAAISLKIEQMLFEEVGKRNKEGRLPEGYFAHYKKDMQKAWIRERESFMGEQKKIRKEVAELFEKKR